MSKNMISLILIVALVALCNSTLIFQKSLPQDHLANGLNITVKLSIYNMGSEPVYEVNVKDTWNDENFEVLGEDEADFATIAGGESAVHTFVVVPNFEGYYVPDRAMYNYKLNEDGETIVGYSNPTYNYTILPVSTYNKLTAVHTNEIVAYWVGIFVVIGLPLLFWLNFQLFFDSGVPRSLKSNKRD